MIRKGSDVGEFPTLRLGPDHMPQKSDICFPHGRDLTEFESRILRVQGFPEERSDAIRFAAFTRLQSHT